MRVLLLYPQNPDSLWSFRHVLRLVGRKSAFPPLGLLTIAAMLPKDWELRLVDTNVSPLRDQDLEWADFVFISAMIVHRDSVRDLVVRYRRLGRSVVGGGPLFTSSQAEFPEVGHVVIGEAEGVVARLVDDMNRGTGQPVYVAEGRPALAQAPIPLWDLIDLRSYVTMPVQFSRGCPYDCEFRDIVVMNGRVPRAKSPPQFVAELEALRLRGWKDMLFVVDDNFIGDKKRTKALLLEICAWRARTGSPMGFFTEASINLADDPDTRFAIGTDSMRGAGGNKCVSEAFPSPSNTISSSASEPGQTDSNPILVRGRALVAAALDRCHKMTTGHRRTLHRDARESVQVNWKIDA